MGGKDGERNMPETQIAVKPRTIIQCIQTALKASGKDSSEAAAIKTLKQVAKMSKKKRAMTDIIIERKPRSDIECVQCALKYIKKDHSEEAARAAKVDMENREHTPEGDDGLPTGYGYVGLENLIEFMGYDKHTLFMDCYHLARKYWIHVYW